MIEIEILLKPFLNQIIQLRKEIKRIQICINQIEEKRKENEESIQEDKNESFEIEPFLLQIQKSSKVIMNQLKTLQTVKENEQQLINSNELLQRIKTNHIHCIERSFIKRMQEYQRIQLEMKKSIQLAVYYRIIKFNPDLQELINENDVDDINPQFLELIKEQGDEIISHYLYQRQKELLSLKKSVEELHEMFLSFTILINKQKEIIYSIEENCNQIQEYIQEAHTNISSASHLKKKYQIVCFFLYFIIFILSKIKKEILILLLENIHSFSSYLFHYYNYSCIYLNSFITSFSSFR